MFGANVCMWVGLILITGIDMEVLIDDGPEPVLQYNPDTFIIFLGAVVVCFEGIGLVLPLRESMEPHMQVCIVAIFLLSSFLLSSRLFPPLLSYPLLSCPILSCVC